MEVTDLTIHFDIANKQLSSEEGYKVSVLDITASGMAFCIFDNEVNRVYAQQLQEEMRLFYEDKARGDHYRKNDQNLQVSEICVAKIPSVVGIKGLTAYEFHRTHIISINRIKATAEIGFVDFYKVMALPIKDLFHITEEFIQVPSFMLKCRLEGLEIFEGTTIVKDLLQLSPPKNLQNAIMFLNTAIIDHLPVVNIYIGVEDSMMNLKDYIFEKLNGMLDGY